MILLNMVERTIEFYPSTSYMYIDDLGHSGGYPFLVRGDGTCNPPSMDGTLPGGDFPGLIFHCDIGFFINSPILETFPRWVFYIEEKQGLSWNIVHTEYSEQYGLQAPNFYSNQYTQLRMLDYYGDSTTRFTLPTSGTHTYRIRVVAYSLEANEDVSMTTTFNFVINCVPRDSLYNVIVSDMNIIQEVSMDNEVIQLIRIFNNYPGRVYYTVRAWEIGGTFEFIEGKDPLLYPGEYRILGTHDSTLVTIPYLCSSPNVTQFCIRAEMIRPV